MTTSFVPFLCLLIISWTFNPFFKKKVLSEVDPVFFSTVNSLLCAFIFSILSVINKVDANIMILKSAWVWASLLTTCTSTLCLMYLLKIAHVGYLIPHTQPVVLLVTLVYSHYSGEYMNTYQKFGVVFVIIGVAMLNLKTKHDLPV